MFGQLSTEKDVLRKLGAKDFRSISKEQIIEFVSNLDKMPKEVAMSCIAQFPEFAKQATIMVNELNTTCQEAMKSCNEAVQKALEGCQSTINTLKTELQSSEFTLEQKLQINEQIINVNSEMVHLVKYHHNVAMYLANIAAGAAALVVVVGGAILGVNTRKH